MPGKSFDSTQGKRFPPDDPREWLNRARSNLVKAQSTSTAPEIYLEDLCFDAQQAAEKAIKAVLIHLKKKFPYVHDLASLLDLVEKAGQNVPETIKQAAKLSDYAVATRYPGLSEPVSQQEYEEAVSIATEVIRWAEELIGKLTDPGRD